MPVRDRTARSHHICADPATPGRVFALYVRNELLSTPTPTPASFLYCKSSSDWSGERLVFNPQPSQLPPQGFATVPPDTSPGFWRISNVWSTVAPNGDVHVVWFDNRAGKADAPNDARDKWRVYRSKSSDSGTTWSAPEQVSTQLSLGGHGQGSGAQVHQPPGDFIGVDADQNGVYVVWPDTREWLDGIQDPKARVYVRRMAL